MITRKTVTSRPRGQGAIGGADPWWHHRKPQNAREEAELLAAGFMLDDGLEQLRVLRDRHPDLFGLAYAEQRFAVEAYERRRAAAMEIGVYAGEHTPELAAKVDRLAALVRETERSPRHPDEIDRTHRATLRGLVAEGAENAALLESFRAWVAELAAEHAYTVRRVSCRRELGLQGGNATVQMRLPRFQAEYAAAVDDVVRGGR